MLKVLTISSVSIWLGAILFFSGLVAPTAFQILEREGAVRLVNTVFPRYYLFGLVLGALALAGVVGRMLGAERPSPWPTLALLLLMLALTLYTLLVLLPQLDAARAAMRAAGAEPAGPSPEARAFARLHGASVILNAITLVAGLALVVLEAVRSRG